MILRRYIYRFITPARASLERGLIQQAWQNIRQHLPEFVGTYIFGELCREWVLRRGDAGCLPFAPAGGIVLGGRKTSN